MKSAKIIRTCAIISAVVSGICTLILAIEAFDSYKGGLTGTLILLIGGFTTVLSWALLEGFADIIDNTYRAANKSSGSNGASTSQYTPNPTYNQYSQGNTYNPYNNQYPQG